MTIGLIADIGGTNARFAWVKDGEKQWNEEKSYKSIDYPEIADAIAEYIESTNAPSDIKKADFCVAGPVNGSDTFAMTNSPWKFSISDIKTKFGWDAFSLFNDFEAVAMGIPYLEDDDLIKFGEGEREERKPIAVLGPGTGLGAASLIWSENKYQAIAGEGGHVTVGARTHREYKIFGVLLDHYTHVSAERICSGKGMENLYDAIQKLDGITLPPREPKDIAAAGLSGECSVCEEIVHLMIRFLARVAGNQALVLGATGGVFLAGGISLHLKELITHDDFRTEFESKGRFRPYMEQIPTYIVKHPFPGFVGLKAHLSSL